MTGMNSIALIVLAVAALCRLVVLVWPPPKLKIRRVLTDLAWFLFVTGFILWALFDFWIVAPVGHG